MARPSRAFRDMLMFLQLILVFVFFCGAGVALMVVCLYFLEACNIVAGVLQVSGWRTAWVFGRLIAAAALSGCGCIAVGNFFFLLERIREGSACSEDGSRMLGRMARCSAIMAVVLALLLWFYTALEMKDAPTMLRIDGVNDLLMCVYIPLAFFTAALVIQGVRLLMARTDLPPEQGAGIYKSSALRDMMNRPKIVFALLQGCSAAWLLPVGLRAAGEARWLYWSVRAGRGAGDVFVIIDMAVWAVMLVVLFLMCGRLRQGQSASSKRNARALLFLAIGCGAHALLGGAVVVYALLPLWMGLCIGLMLVATVLGELLIDRKAKRIY